MSLEDRLGKLLAKMDEGGLDAFIVRNNADLRWLTGMTAAFDEEEAHAAFIAPGILQLHTDSRYTDLFGRKLAGSPWTLDGSSVSHAAFIAGQASACKAKRIGIDDAMGLAEYHALSDALSALGPAPQIVETHELIKTLRAVKDSDEIAAMKAAQAITDAGFEHICGYIKPGISETAIALELEFFMRSQGSEGLAFPSIIAAGEDGASPHSTPSSREVAKGDMIIMDFGARVADYRADMTRTVMCGQPSARQSEVYDIVRKANEKVEAAIKPGIICSDMHKMAVDSIMESGCGGCFSHGLGHGVGIDIHEMPLFNPRGNYPLVAGNVVTVEPGVYLAGQFGVRIEDFGAVTQTGYDVFTQSSHDMVIL